MREILFRGKRIDNGEWVKGCLLIDYVSGQYFIHANGNSVNESDKVNEEGCLRFLAYEVSPETVCQYTGLTDKNGRKIFEGDIVETVFDGKQNPNYVVVWDADELDFKATNGKEYYKRNFEYLGCCDEIIAIGNIFDNPEFLKEEST